MMKKQLLTVAMLLSVVVVFTGIKVESSGRYNGGHVCAINEEMDTSGDVESSDDEDEKTLDDAATEESDDEIVDEDVDTTGTVTSAADTVTSTNGAVKAAKKRKPVKQTGKQGSKTAGSKANWKKNRAKFKALKEKCPDAFESFKTCRDKCAKDDKACKRACRDAFKTDCKKVKKAVVAPSKVPEPSKE